MEGLDGFGERPEGLEGFGGLGGGFGGWSNRESSTPAVVPGAAPALAKAGIGRFLFIFPFLTAAPIGRPILFDMFVYIVRII